MLIKTNNPTNEGRETTALSADVPKGESALPILNIDGFSANDYIVIRRVGDEQAELRQITSVSAGTLNLSSTVSHSHHVGAEVFVIPYNQIEISRKLTKTSSWSVLTTTNIEVDSVQTVYEDTQGQEANFYRVRLFNSQTGQYSSYSNSLKGEGASTRQAGKVIDIILDRTGDDDAQATPRSKVLTDLNLAYQQVYNAILRSSSEYYQVKYEIATEDNKNDYTLPDNFKEIVRIKNGSGDIIPPVPIADTYNSRGYELTGRLTLSLEDVPSPDTTSTVTKTTIIQNNAFDESGTWTASADASNVTTDNIEFKSGDGSVKFDVDVSASATNTAIITNSTFTAVDLNSYDKSGKIRILMYIPDVTYTNTVTLKWGSASSNYWSLAMEKDYKNKAFHDGWNLIEFDWGSSSATETGTVVPTAIGYLQVVVAYSANQADATDYRIDRIQVANTWSGNDIYEVTYLKHPAQVTNEMDEFEIPEGYQFLLVDYGVAQILLKREERKTEAEALLRNFNRNISKFITQSAKRTRRVIGFSTRIKRAYRFISTDSSRIVHSDGNITEL